MNYRILIIGILLTAFLPSCDIKGQQEPELKIDDVSLYAYGKNLSWEQNDSIAVYDGYTIHKYMAEFKSDTSKFLSHSTLNEEAVDLYAMYPYESETIRTEVGLEIDLKSQQDVSLSAMDTSSCIYVAYTNDIQEKTYLNFQEICSYFSFSVKEDYGIVKVVLSGADDEYLAGKFEVTFSNKEPQINVLEGVNEVSVSSNSSMNGTYQICLLPVVLQDGLTVTFVSEDGSTAQKKIVAKVDEGIGSAMVFVRGRVNSNPIVFDDPFETTPDDPTPDNPEAGVKSNIEDYRNQILPDDFWGTPMDPTPEDPVPEEPTPEDPTPEEPTSDVESNVEDFHNQILPDDFWGTPMDPTPEDPVPENPTPEDPVPEDPTPEDPTPEEPTPEDPTPEEPTSDVESNVEDFHNQILPDDFWGTPMDPTPEDPVPEDPSPEEPTPEEPSPEDPTPEEPTPEEPLPEEPTSDVESNVEDFHNQILPDDFWGTPMDPTPEDSVPENPSPEEPTPENPTPEDPTPEEPSPEDPTPEEPTPEEPLPEEPTSDVESNVEDFHNQILPDDFWGTPMDPTPEDPTPEEPTPEEPLPDDPTSDVESNVEDFYNQILPDDFWGTPMDPTPEDPVPENPSPEAPVPEDPTPEDPTPEEPTPENPGNNVDSGTEDFNKEEIPDDFWS